MSPAAARKIFVAGGTGVLGRRVVPLLVEAGHDVLINTRNPEAMASAEAAGAHTTTVDLFNADAVAEAGGRARCGDPHRHVHPHRSRVGLKAGLGHE